MWCWRKCEAFFQQCSVFLRQLICAEVVYGHVGWLSYKRWSKKGDKCAAGGRGQVCLDEGLGFFCFLDLWWLHLCRFLFLLVAVGLVVGRIDFEVAAVVPLEVAAVVPFEVAAAVPLEVAAVVPLEMAAVVPLEMLGGGNVGYVFRVCCSSG